MSMANEGSELPSAEYVEPAVLARIFRATTNSYKYLFFQALLQHAAEPGGSSPPRLAVSDLLTSALEIAWYPLIQCHLSFGPQDKLGHVLREIRVEDEKASPRTSDPAFTQRRRAIAARLSVAQAQSLARWVPYRLLTPWFEAQIRDVHDSARNARIEALSRTEFHFVRPLYRLESRGSFIQVHPDWWEYLRRNVAVVSDWARWQWLTFLQQRNPTALNIRQKLEAPRERRPLTKQRAFWADVMARCETRCIYSGKPLASPEALDHFMPWSFLGNDARWNLIPVSKSANSSKRDAVPELAEYLPKLIASHSDALASSVGWMDGKQRARLLAEYADGLRVPLQDLGADLQTVTAALTTGYQGIMPTLEGLARSQGFSVGWRLEGTPELRQL